MEKWTSGTGQKLMVHSEGLCEGYCPIHNPSDHHMIDWPLHWRGDRGILERMCKCGVGHPDPDDLSTDTVHGCCGCCAPPLPNIWQRLLGCLAMQKLHIIFLKLTLAFIHVEQENYHQAHATLKGKKIYGFSWDYYGPHYPHAFPCKQFIISTMAFIAGCKDGNK
jgi:hypothetical protein